MTVNERSKKRRLGLKKKGLCVDCGMEPVAKRRPGRRRYADGHYYTPSSRPHVLGERCLAARRAQLNRAAFEPAVSKEQAEREFLALTSDNL
jgi:hypothetical protein